MEACDGIEGSFSALVIGARGGIGHAFCETLLAQGVQRVFATSRHQEWVDLDSPFNRLRVDLEDESSLAAASEEIAQSGVPLRFVINCSGILHDGDMQPERSWRDLNAEHMRRSFAVNTIGLALIVKHIVPLIPRRERSIFASLSARVGSIEDNRLGGWYSYRASKASHNMILKCASIESKSRKPGLIMTALHPGTVATHLSEPFRARVSHEVFSAQKSCQLLSDVLGKLTPEEHGKHLAWDGSQIPW